MINEVRPLLLRDFGGKNRKKRNMSYGFSAVYRVAIPKDNRLFVPFPSPFSDINRKKASGFGKRSTDAGR